MLEVACRKYMINGQAPNLEFSNPSIYARERIVRGGGAGFGVVGPQCITNAVLLHSSLTSCIGDRLKES